MDKNLQAAIHKYAEDREIDYMSAKVIGEHYGIVFKKEKDLVEFKQVVDRYLGTFEPKDFAAIEEMCSKNKKKVKNKEKNLKEVKEPYDMDPKTIAKYQKLADEAGMTLEKYLEMKVVHAKSGIRPSKREREVAAEGMSLGQFFDKKLNNLKESDDRNNGEQKEYYKNGKLYKQWFMKNGKYHGECKIYDKEGKLFKKIMYNNGQMVDDYTK